MIDLEIYLERHHLIIDGTVKVEKTSLTGCIGRGEYIVGRGRLHVRSYKLADGDGAKNFVGTVSEVMLGFERDTQSVIKLDTSGIGRMHVSPNQWLVVQDNSVLPVDKLAS